MPKYTLLCISRWIVLGPRVWVWLRLIVGLVAVVSFPTDGNLPALWVWPDERSGGGWEWSPSRVGRLSGVLQASSVCLACRVGLLASVIGGSGLTIHSPAVWHLIGLPLGDWALGVLGWMWPRLRVKPLFQDLRDLLHRAYQWSVIGLGLLVVHRWLHMGLSGVVLGSRVVCERDGSHVELECQPGPEGQTTYRVHLVGEFVYAVTPRDEFEKRLVLLDLATADTRPRG